MTRTLCRQHKRVLIAGLALGGFLLGAPRSASAQG